MKKVILASQSPRRKMLLEWAEVKFEVRIKETDESFSPGMNSEEAAMHIARNKAYAVEIASDEIIIAADTIVVLNNEIIGKPRSAEHAVSILSALSGNSHQVITGVLMRDLNKEVSFYDVTEVEFHQLSREQIELYVEKYKPYDKAGAYAIQEWIGVVGIKSIHGDFYNVMGLPVSRVVKTLSQFE